MAGGMGAFAGTQFGSVAGMGNVFGGGCQKVDSVTVPSARPQWTCGLESTGRWTCAGQANMQYLMLLACLLHVWHHCALSVYKFTCSLLNVSLTKCTL